MAASASSALALSVMPPDALELPEEPDDELELDEELPDEELPDEELPDEELPDEEVPDKELPDEPELPEFDVVDADDAAVDELDSPLLSAVVWDAVSHAAMKKATATSAIRRCNMVMLPV